jgi:phosphate transport system protein
MFKNLFDIWKGKDFINSVHDDFSTMLDLSEKMFKEAQWFIFIDDARPDMQEDIYKMDKDINKLERKIRTRILEHLSMQPSVDLSTSLIMMSVIKDAERLGDYIKNISEVRDILQEPINQELYKKFLIDIDEQISDMFALTKKAFLNSDEELAQQIGNQKKLLSSKCETIILEIANSDIPTKIAVAYALLARYYKRLICHLGNIATTVILPFSDINYYDNKENNTSQNIIIGLCTANRCRSQMFEAILKHLSQGKFQAVSAGTKATFVHPLAKKVLEEIGIPVKDQMSKKIEKIDNTKKVLVLIDEANNKTEYPLEKIHYVITLCGGAKESCPMFPGKVNREHWPIDDPDQYKGTEEEILPHFRNSRDDIYKRVQDLLSRL